MRRDDRLRAVVQGSAGLSGLWAMLVWCAGCTAIAPVMAPAPAPVPDAASYLRMEARPSRGLTAPSSRRWNIYLDGYIDSSASQRLTQLIGQHGITDAAVYFNSPGGSLVEGMAIGRTLRARGFETHVGARPSDAGPPAHGVCYSACPFAFAGGVQRYLEEGSVLGVHRAENRVRVPDESAFQKLVSQQATEYLAAMGIRTELFAIMEKVPQNQIRVLTRREAEQLNLVNEREGRP